MNLNSVTKIQDERRKAAISEGFLKYYVNSDGYSKCNVKSINEFILHH